MTPGALARLREQVRLKQLKTAVSIAEGPKVEQLLAQSGHTLTTLTEKIQELSPAPIETDEPFVDIPYNEAQQRFIDALCNGEPVALTGPAGSGKTTAVKGGIRRLIQEDKVPAIPHSTHKHIHAGTPGVVCCAFTNKAVENMKRVLPKDLRKNCITIHKLLEFQPEYFDVYNSETGQTTKSMQFVPKRNADNPLPEGIKVIFIDEATMVAVELWNLLADAIAYPVQIVLIGDIQQLPPVFGKPIFIYAMQHGITKIELTDVHRQALESPIINIAHRILAGTQIPGPRLAELNYDGEHGKLEIRPWKKKLSDTGALKLMGMFLPEMIDAESYDPLNDVILTPFNKNFGTIELNKIVATHLAKVERTKNPGSPEGIVYEIIAGISKKYFRIGDKVLYNKTEHFITGIKRNPKYLGKLPKTASDTMDYNGIESDPLKSFTDDEGQLLDKTIEDVDFLLASMNFHEEEDDRSMPRSASHILTLFSEALDQEVELDTTGEVGYLDLGYALTVHKSQGSEYPRVLFITHESQANMLYRELIYTAVTRAKRELLVVCPPYLFVKGVNSQRLPGRTLEDKLVAFDRNCQLQKGAKAEQPMRLDLFKVRKPF